MTVTAHLVQTSQGPRMVLQGTQGIQLGQAQLVTIRHQVKQQLMKQQALASQQGKVPPTNITIQLARDGGRRTEIAASQSEEPAPTLLY